MHSKNGTINTEATLFLIQEHNNPLINRRSKVNFLNFFCQNIERRVTLIHMYIDENTVRCRAKGAKTMCRAEETTFKATVNISFGNKFSVNVYFERVILSVAKADVDNLPRALFRAGKEAGSYKNCYN